MKDTVWAGRILMMINVSGVPKGLKQILEERGANTGTLKGLNMRIIWSNHDDFRTEKTIVENILNSRGHWVHFIQKFLCEMNSIEQVLGQATLQTRIHTNFTLPGLKNIITSTQFCDTGQYKIVFSKLSWLWEGILGRTQIGKSLSWQS